MNEAMKIIITLALDLSVTTEDSAKTNKVKLTKSHQFYLEVLLCNSGECLLT